MSLKARNNNLRNPIGVVLFTGYKLIREHLCLLLESKSEIEVQGFASTPDELLSVVMERQPCVVLFCLLEDETEHIEVMPQMFEVSPETKAVILSALNGKLDQTKVLKLGAAGIVGAHQREEVLIRAIRQVAEGEVFFNQQLMAQILGNDKDGKASVNGSIPDAEGGNGPREGLLTTRELEVIEVIAKGLTNKEISKKLYISEATVRHHLSSIYSKLYVEDRLNLVIYAYQHDLVSKLEREEGGSRGGH